MNDRVMRLENPHRSFRVSLKSEFDSVRERLEHLRPDPDLGSLGSNVQAFGQRTFAKSGRRARSAEISVTAPRGASRSQVRRSFLSDPKSGQEERT